MATVRTNWKKAALALVLSVPLALGSAQLALGDKGVVADKGLKPPKKTTLLSIRPSEQLVFATNAAQKTLKSVAPVIKAADRAAQKAIAPLAPVVIKVADRAVQTATRPLRPDSGPITPSSVVANVTRTVRPVAVVAEKAVAEVVHTLAPEEDPPKEKEPPKDGEEEPPPPKDTHP